jgi:hypothetical protein
MATCSITDPFVVKAADFYRAVEEADQLAAERKKRPASPPVHVREMTNEELEEFMKGYK